jgi:hypothetical protein
MNQDDARKKKDCECSCLVYSFSTNATVNERVDFIWLYISVSECISLFFYLLGDFPSLCRRVRIEMIMVASCHTVGSRRAWKLRTVELARGHPACSVSRVLLVLIRISVSYRTRQITAQRRGGKGNHLCCGCVHALFTPPPVPSPNLACACRLRCQGRRPRGDRSRRLPTHGTARACSVSCAHAGIHASLRT